MFKDLRILFWMLVIFFGRSAFSSEPSVEKSFTGFGYELLISRMEHLEDRFRQQEIQIENLNKLIVQNQQQLLDMLQRNFQKQESETKKLSVKISQNQQDLKENIMKVHKQSDDMLRYKNLLDHVLEHSFMNKSYKSCKDAPPLRSGRYLLQPFENEKKFLGYCEQTKYDGGWLVIQHRFDGSVDFFQNWTAYRDGFGDIGGEFWLGLDKIHRLTKAKKHILLVEMKDFNDNYAYAKYDGFEIGGENEMYSLKTLGAYSGTAGDSLAVHSGQKFTTKDRDNDYSDTSNCADDYKGAWWYRNCHNSNLNALYSKEDVGQSITWAKWYNRVVGLKFTKMMIREV